MGVGREGYVLLEGGVEEEGALRDEGYFGGWGVNSVNVGVVFVHLT